MALFIGGRADGRRMAVDEGARYIRLPYHRPMRVAELTDASEATLTMQVENYVRVHREIYVHEELERQDLLDLLVSGYRHEREK